MFLHWFINLRLAGVPVTLTEWLDMAKVMESGLVGDVDQLYGVGRALLAKTENRYDDYDIAFSATFGDGQIPVTLKDEFSAWLKDPVPAQFNEELLKRLSELDPDELRRRFEEMLKNQQERHDGGSRYIGTGGTSPFGSGGYHPSGVRVGPGGGRMAARVAHQRRYQEYRSDAVLDVRQFEVALKTLRHLLREGPEELHLDRTIHRTCQNAGEIELVFDRARRNSLRLLLIMDVGGSMDPFAQICDRLFSAASKANHFKSFKNYWFHNCVYERLGTNMARGEFEPTFEVLEKSHPETCVIFVGDACMHPWELMQPGWSIDRWERVERRRGIDWIKSFADRFDRCIWLNPEPTQHWQHPTIEAIGDLIDMYPLTLDGLKEGIHRLRR